MPKVTFKTTGQTVEVPKGKNLREVIQENGWPIPFGCENGICGTCLVQIVSGKENLEPIQEAEDQTLKAMGQANGDHRLACQCEVMGDVVIEG
ncbi:MAG: ferredoxin [Candidatus Peregrinibacteria bacterium GW2011_GWF2_39_17]|nr:MAG: ferredoxin [Candidatus Peregrinibacteria bacterium GW2011_GWF2_39_17]